MQRSALSFLNIILCMSFSSAYAVRFHTEDWGDGPKTQYPSQVKDIGHREAEVFALAEKFQLGARFPYLHLINLIKKDKHPFERFINEVVDGILAQTHPDLQVSLRRFYYYGERIEFNSESIKKVNGVMFFQAIPQQGGQFIVTFDPEVQKVPLIFKLYKMKAILELSHWGSAIGERFDGDYRNKFPVVDFLSKVSGAILVQDILSKFGYRAIQAEILMSDIPDRYKDSFRQDFLNESYVRAQISNWIFLFEGLGKDKMSDWINRIILMRDQKSASIKSLEVLQRPLVEKIQKDLLARKAERSSFLLAQQARQAGDSLSFSLIGQMMTISGGGPQCSVMFNPKSSR